jgi:hypothetical protein
MATIQPGVVTLAKMTNLAANSIIGNNTGVPATPLALTPAQVSTFLGLGTAASATIGTIGMTVPYLNASLTFAGPDVFQGAVTIQGSLTTNVTGVTPFQCLHVNTAGVISGLGVDCGAAGGAITQLSGDVTTGTGGGVQSAPISLNAVTFAKMQQIPANTIMGNNTVSTANPLALTTAQVSTLLNLGTAASATIGTTGMNVPLLNGNLTFSGTDIFSSTLAVNGSLTINVTGVAQNCLQANATGLVSGTGSPCGTGAGSGITGLVGDVVAGPSASGNGVMATIPNNTVTFAKMQTIGANTIMGNNSGVSAVPTALTASQVGTLLGVFPITSTGNTLTLTSCSTGPSCNVDVAFGVSTPAYGASGTTTCNFTKPNYTCQPVVMSGGNTTLAITPGSMTTGVDYVLIWVQDGTGGRTVTNPASFSGVCTPGAWTEANVVMTIHLTWDGTTAHEASCVTNAAATFMVGPERAAFTTIAANQQIWTFDSASHTMVGFANASANRLAVPRVASGNQLQCSDILNVAASCGTDATNATNITAGTLAAARLPASAIQRVNTTIAVALPTTTVNATSCDAAATQGTITGLATTDGVALSPNADPTAIAGYGPGGLYVWWWVTANTINFKRCNPTASNITTVGALTFNVVSPR